LISKDEHQIFNQICIVGKLDISTKMDILMFFHSFLKHSNSIVSMFDYQVLTLCSSICTYYCHRVDRASNPCGLRQARGGVGETNKRTRQEQSTRERNWELHATPACYKGTTLRYVTEREGEH